MSAATATPVSRAALAAKIESLDHDLVRRVCLASLLAAILLASSVANAQTQAGPYERTYRQSKSAVERALKDLRPSLSGRLPTIEGFAVPGVRAGDRALDRQNLDGQNLDRYERAYYQSTVQVSATPSGGSLVRVTTKITAWYSDPIPSQSGYQLLTSNGRLENDLLDELAERLATAPVASTKPTDRDASRSTAPGPNLSAPVSPSPTNNAASPSTAFPPTSSRGLSAQELANSKNSQTPLDPKLTGLEAEAASLEEVLKNQAHPKNLVAIKKSGTPVVASPSLTGKTLFLADARDEFEMLDYNADWVHVRISGLSRGWIWRTSLEMPEGIPDVPSNDPRRVNVAADLFQVTREENAPFPGDWEPLRGKNVKIISVQKVQEDEKDSGAQAKLEFAKSLLDKNYADVASKSQELFGIVLIFDSIDGGMIAATLPTVQKWKAGGLTDAALWHQCYFDPPETFTVSNVVGGH